MFNIHIFTLWSTPIIAENSIEIPKSNTVVAAVLMLYTQKYEIVTGLKKVQIKSAAYNLLKLLDVHQECQQNDEVPI